MTKPISKAKLKEIVSAVTDTGRNRRQNFGPDFSQADYVAGAMAVLHAVGVEMIDVPAVWIMGNMAGIDIFAPEPAEAKE